MSTKPRKRNGQFTKAETPSLRRQYSDWPQPGDTRPQPWDLDALEVPKSERELAPGAPDTVSPIVIRHQCPTLTSGAAGPLVAELAQRLAELGYESSISRGENAWAVLDHSVMGAVQAFRHAYGVEEDPTPWGGRTPDAISRAAAHVGPYTWEALIRVSDRRSRHVHRGEFIEATSTPSLRPSYSESVASWSTVTSLGTSTPSLRPSCSEPSDAHDAVALADADQQSPSPRPLAYFPHPPVSPL